MTVAIPRSVIDTVLSRAFDDKPAEEILRWGLDTFAPRIALSASFGSPEGMVLLDMMHNIDPAKGLFHALTPAKRIGEWNDRVRCPESTSIPPADTRAHGRGRAVALFQTRQLPYVINWDSISLENSAYLPMPNPFETYTEEVEELIAN